ncbi:exonuclease mut-7 homolog isoform X2 [Nematostella vectensis]|uniref:exonuclease mut-7 homolog isoform X2 n=1 Tax=Nematostella vectensis TaxID=45351 RepID=UPI002076E5D5|nr:exonuclease mut-7 homolog isoform X2 [Nematostella vectensis]
MLVFFHICFAILIDLIDHFVPRSREKICTLDESKILEPLEEVDCPDGGDNGVHVDGVKDDIVQKCVAQDNLVVFIKTTSLENTEISYSLNSEIGTSGVHLTEGSSDTQGDNLSVSGESWDENCDIEQNNHKVSCMTANGNAQPEDLSEDTLVPASTDISSYRDWLEELESLYFSNLIDDLKQFLHRSFSSVDDPFDFVLYMLRFSDYDIYTGKKSIAHLTLVEFESWLQDELDNRTSEELTGLIRVPTKQHKDNALELVVTTKLLLFEPVRRAFQLDTKDNSFLEEHVRFLLHSGRRYKEAANIATKLSLQTCFEPKEILLPLLILDKLQLAESYVDSCPWQQKAYVAMLDKLCGKSDEELQKIVDDANIHPKPREHKLRNKILVKVADRLVKRYRLSGEDFPNIYKERNLSGLYYLLHKKYQDENSNKKWDNLIETSIGNKVWLQERLIEGLLEFNDLDEAIRWTHFYGLPLDRVPSPVSQAIEDCEAANSQSSSTDWDDPLDHSPEPLKSTAFVDMSPTPKAHSLALPPERVFLVDDECSLQDCLAVLSKGGPTIGFDAEWRPTMCRAESDDKLAIIQLATWNEVFILDMIALKTNVSSEQLTEFAFAVFANPRVLKLGYGVETDFKVMLSSCPPFKEALNKVKRFVDLCHLSKEVMWLPQVKKRLQEQKILGRYEMERGLSELVLQCVGLPLDKTCQVSDWERRPLSQEQLTYAALDAYCLLEVYHVLCAWVKESGSYVDMEPKLYLPSVWPEQKKSRQAARRKIPKPGSIGDLSKPAREGDSIPAPSLSVVADTMLQGLGRQLRCCGVDVIIMENGSSHDAAAKIARDQRRILLTSGTPYHRLRSRVPEGMCMCVPAGNPRQQVAAVFHHFNVRVTVKDIFSRCQICNGNQYAKVLPEHMRTAYEIYKGRLRLPSSFQPPADCPIDLITLRVGRGVQLKMGILPDGIWDNERIELFYCCVTCGKIFWEGKHFERVIAQFAHVLDSGSTENIYRTLGEKSS